MIVALVTCVAGITNEFTQDDVALIQETTRLHGLSELPEILTSPYWPPPYAADLYRPVTSLFLASQYAAGGGAPLVFRLVSYALYGAASVMLFRLAARLLPGAVALFVAWIFAAHPVHVETVVIAVAQSEIIVALLTTIAVSRYLDRRNTTDASLQRRDWAFLGMLFGLAALAKEQGFLLPAFLLLTEVFLVDRGSWRARIPALWKGYVFLGLVAVALLAIRAAVLGEQAMRPAPAEALIGASPGQRLLTMFHIVPQWLRLLGWPAHLRADYSPQELVASHAFGMSEALGLAVLLAGAVVVVRTRRRMPSVAFGLSWCALALFPVSNLVIPTGILIAERTLFLPSIGFVLAVGGVAALVLERLRGRVVAMRAIAAACALVVLAGVIKSVSRQRVYRDNRTLSLQSVHDSPRSWRAQQAFGEAMFDLGRSDEGERAYRQAISLAPSPWWVRNSLAQRLRLVGEDERALEELRLSMAQHPSQIEPIPEITAALLALGRYDEARSVADQAIAVAGAPPIMVWLRHVADSALRVKAPAGSIRIGVRTR